MPLVRAYLAHRKMREDAILARLKAGDRSIADIVKAIYADDRSALHAAAALSTLAHLEHLIEQAGAGPARAARAGVRRRTIFRNIRLYVFKSGGPLKTSVPETRRWARPRSCVRNQGNS